MSLPTLIAFVAIAIEGVLICVVMRQRDDAQRAVRLLSSVQGDTAATCAARVVLWPDAERVDVKCARPLGHGGNHCGSGVVSGG